MRAPPPFQPAPAGDRIAYSNPKAVFYYLPYMSYTHFYAFYM